MYEDIITYPMVILTNFRKKKSVRVWRDIAAVLPPLTKHPDAAPASLMYIS